MSEKTKEITTIPLQFKNKTQITLFLKLINAKEPLNRKQICNDTGIAWSTAFDNLTKMSNKMCINGSHLISKYTTISNGKVGRPQVKWLISEKIKRLFYTHFFTFEIQ